ncbi:hypothetical protein M0Q28_05570 [Patescibacteria group bacterium]|jgi:hypothetical protein|nr:hypothetical protein [Patescibacteria group bacterium]
MIETLKKFCAAADGSRINLHPWSKGEYSYATNGHIIARVPRLADVPERDGALSTDYLFPYADPPAWFALSDIELAKVKTVDCSECDGDGEVRHEECPDCDGHPCPDCDGTGKVTPMQPVAVGNSHYQLAYLLILKALPNCKIGPNVNPMYQAPFTFDGGDGLLMPMKPFGEWSKV